MSSSQEQVYVDFVSNFLWSNRDFTDNWNRYHNNERVSIEQFREELASNPQFLNSWNKFKWNTDALSNVNSTGELDWWKQNNTLQSCLKKFNVIHTEAPLDGTAVQDDVSGRAKHNNKTIALADTLRETSALFINAYAQDKGLELNDAIHQVDILLKELKNPEARQSAAVMFLKLLNAFEPFADTETSIQMLQLAKTQCSEFLNR